MFYILQFSILFLKSIYKKVSVKYIKIILITVFIYSIIISLFYSYISFSNKSDSNFISSKTLNWKFIEAEFLNSIQNFNENIDELNPINIQSKKYFLSVCNQVKNEYYQIIPWIEFHLMVGVDKFYIYDHQSTDNLEQNLKPYIDKGQVEYILWPDHLNKTKWDPAAGSLYDIEQSIQNCNEGIWNDGCQLVFYSDCIARSSKESEFVSHFDVDEYMFVSLPKNVKHSKKTIEGSLKKFLQYFPFDNYRVSGPMFGEQRIHENELIIETVRLHEAHQGAYSFKSSHMFKSIARHIPKHSLFSNGHEYRYGIQNEKNIIDSFSNLCSVDPNAYNIRFINIEKQFEPDPFYGILRFNHYRFSELERKRKYNPHKYSDVFMEYVKPFKNCTCDHIAYLIPFLKERLDNISYEYVSDFQNKENRICDWCDSVPVVDYLKNLTPDLKKNLKYVDVDIAKSTYTTCENRKVSITLILVCIVIFLFIFAIIFLLIIHSIRAWKKKRIDKLFNEYTNSFTFKN